MKAEGNVVSIEGIYTKKPKIIKINQYPVDVETEGTMLIAKYKDIPGIIGSIGTTLGEHNINIAKMQVGRRELGGEAVMVLKVDQQVPIDVIAELKEIEDVYEAVAVNL
jgi:D-3-phosphoglycerate dehydrogenase